MFVRIQTQMQAMSCYSYIYDVIFIILFSKSNKVNIASTSAPFLTPQRKNLEALSDLLHDGFPRSPSDLNVPPRDVAAVQGWSRLDRSIVGIKARNQTRDFLNAVRLNAAAGLLK